jgi:hypothetical protein
MHMIFYIFLLSILIWPDDGCRRQPKRVVVLYNKIKCAVTEYLFARTT